MSVLCSRRLNGSPNPTRSAGPIEETVPVTMTATQPANQLPVERPKAKHKTSLSSPGCFRTGLHSKRSILQRRQRATDSSGRDRQTGGASRGKKRERGSATDPLSNLKINSIWGRWRGEGELSFGLVVGLAGVAWLFARVAPVIRLGDGLVVSPCRLVEDRQALERLTG